MSKIMLVNVTHVEESRVAIVEDSILAAYEIETINRTSIKGNIYNAVVETTHTSLEAGFIRIATDQKGFLPLDEVNFKLLPARGDDREKGKISKHLHAGQRLMVQVVREPFAGKPPTVSTFFSLPGRYLVLMPGVDTVGISRKIEDQKQRDRLKKILDELKPPEGFGVIVRTAGTGQTKAELQRDLRYLLRLWESIQKGSAANEFPGLVYRERDLVLRTIRDHFTPDISEVWIDSQEIYDRTLEFMKEVLPKRSRNLRLYTGERPLFNKFNLEQQIETIYKRRVPLPSGGEIVIDGTEALTAIDVNSARSSRKADAEDNATQTNLEAAQEIVRQLRLRDLGGLVVVDFIDMLSMRNKKKVEKAVRDAMRGDKAKYDITRLSKLGLVEIARQRLKGEKMGASYTTCPGCEGYGLVKNIEAAGVAAIRKLQTRSARGGFGLLRVELPPEVANWILNNKKEELVHMEQRHGIQLAVEPKDALRRHEISFQAVAREKTDEVPYPQPAPVVAPPEPPAPEATRDKAGHDSRDRGPEGDGRKAAAQPKKKRRRRRKPADSSREAQEASGSREQDEAPSSEPAERGTEKAPAAKTGEPDGVPPGKEDGPATGEQEAGATQGRKRKRRRRKRRPRGSTAGNGDRTGSNGKTGGQQADAAIPAPVRVDSTELMPAATGAKQSSAAARKEVLKPRPRKRRSDVVRTSGKSDLPADPGTVQED